MHTITITRYVSEQLFESAVRFFGQPVKKGFSESLNEIKRAERIKNLRRIYHKNDLRCRKHFDVKSEGEFVDKINELYNVEL